jgi:hypothetical protein
MFGVGNRSRELMLRSGLKVLGMCAAMVAPQAQAEGVLVELFTSQGCSSCPPADEILGQLAKRDDVIALSLHVDYWDYLGWKDQFADVAFSNRQKAYARAMRSTMIYTPQMVVGGVDSVVGTRTMELMDHLAKHNSRKKAVQIAVSKASGQIEVRGKAVAKTPSKMVVQLVRYTPSATVAIKRGENAGRDITYHNVVKSWTVIGTWDGAEPLNLQAPLEGDAPSVVVIQDGASGPVLAVARID